MGPLRALIAVLIISVFTGIPVYADEESHVGRYVIYVVETSPQEKTPFLLDTETGKIWMYEKKGSFDKGSGFKGMAVEGLAYDSGSKDKIDEKISEWAVKGLVDKNVTGYKEVMDGELSYSPDVMRAQELNKMMRAREPKKEK